MGTCTGSDFNSNKQLQQLREQLILIYRQHNLPRLYNDLNDAFSRLQGPLEILDNLQYPKFSLIRYIREVSLQEYMESEQIWQDKFDNSNHHHILSLHYLLEEEINNFIYTKKQITMFFDNPLLTLNKHRFFVQSIEFPEEDIWFLLDCVASALAFLQTKQKCHGLINLYNIYEVMTPFKQTVYKISEGIFKNLDTTLKLRVIKPIEEITKEELKELKNKYILTPLQLQSIRDQVKYPKQNFYKADVFALGLVCLYCIDRIPCKDMYDWQKFTLNEDYLTNRINEANVTFQLKQLLQSMLNIDETLRIDPLELDQQISTLYEQMKMTRLRQIYQPKDFYYTPFGQLGLNIEESKILEQASHEILKTQESQPKSQKIAVETGKLFKPLQISVKKEKVDLQQRNNFAKELRINYINGHYYQGETVGGRRKGIGTQFNASGKELIVGTWDNDLPEGDMIYYNYPEPHQTSEYNNHENLDRLDWVTFKGQVKVGKRNGYGTLTFVNGDKFVGQYYNMRANGPGMYIKENGETIYGQWRNDLFSYK